MRAPTSFHRLHWRGRAREESVWRSFQEVMGEVTARFPDRPAVFLGPTSWTFRELDRRAAAVAASLRVAGVRPGDLVGLCAGRRLETIAALLGILRMGAAYVPLTPDLPTERLRLVAANAGLGAIVAESGQMDRLASLSARRLDLDTAVAFSGPDLVHASAEEDVIYVIHTSGSTGVPKGVRIPQRGLMNFLRSFWREPGLTESDRVLALATFSFDLSLLEILPALAAGASVVLANDAMRLDGPAIARVIVERGVTILPATPSLLRMLRDTGWEGNRAVKVLAGAEPISRALVNDLAPRCAALWNLYGPTEVSICATCIRLEAGEGPVPIGRPIDNMDLTVVDETLQPVAEGEVGELLIAGEGVGLGYLGQAVSESSAFLPDPDRPGRLRYRTGDLVRCREGVFEYLGRVDDQVKIRGFRVEPGEIESQLAACHGVRQAVVVVHGRQDASARLCAFVVGTAGSEALRRELAARLPDYMVPALIVARHDLPLTPSGKVDRVRLAALADELSSPTGGAAAETALERQVAEAWAVALGRNDFGCAENFFDVGGDSLRLAVVHARLRGAGHHALAITDLFANPSVRALARFLEAGEPGGTSAARTRAAKQREAFAARRASAGSR